MVDLNDGTCSRCGYDFRTEVARQSNVRLQFGLRFLFFLMCLTTFTCTVSKAVGSWLPAPLLVVNGLLFWRTRRAKYACLPGFALGFAIGWVLMELCGGKDLVLVACLLATVVAGFDAERKGYYSGWVAVVAAMMYHMILSAFFRNPFLFR
jgi:hypothetical protein